MTKPENLDLVIRLRAGHNFYAESSLWFDSKLANAVDEAAGEIERLRSEMERLELALQQARAEERARCRDLVRRYMPAGWTALYDAIGA